MVGRDIGLGRKELWTYVVWYGVCVYVLMRLFIALEWPFSEWEGYNWMGLN